MLGASIGLPYFVLSTTGPLMQHWFCRKHPGRSPYRLYALSNVGSLLALVSFPFLFEPHFTRHHQAVIWGWGLVAYGIACSSCALRFLKARRSEGSVPEETGAAPISQLSGTDPLPECAPTVVQRSLWVLLPASASVLLLATTNKMCLDVAVIPFLWVLPLAIYLFSFIIFFDNPLWYLRFPITLALVAALA